MGEHSLVFPSRSLAPHLVPREDPLGYIHPDTWDASTPGELHEASWGIWMRGLRQSGATGGFTLILSTVSASVDDMLWMATPRGFTPGVASSIFVRRIQGQRIWYGKIHAVYGLTEGSANLLAQQPQIAPVIWSPGGCGWAMAFPPGGATPYCADAHSASGVSEVLGGGYFTEVFFKDRPSLRVWRDHYGYNPIAEFRRLFERRA